MTRMGMGSFAEEGDDFVKCSGVVRGHYPSGKAIRYYFSDLEEEKSVPVSVCGSAGRPQVGTQDIEIRRWWCEKERVV